MKITTIGLDLAKQVFQIHGVNEAGDVVVKRRLRRAQVITYFASLPACLIGMEPAPPRTSGRASCARWGTRCA
jgi:transposase